MANNHRVMLAILVATLAACLMAVLVVGTQSARALGPNAVRSGFSDNVLPANDDGSSGAVDIGFPVNFFGNTYTQVYVNNNGNLTFDQSLPDYTPGDLVSTGRVIIAPFWADVDTRVGNTATYGYGQGAVDGHDAFGANWVGVGYYNQHQDKLNDFQVVLVDRSDTGAGNFDIELNYDRVEWESGDASGGVGGLGGTSARAGYSNGTGNPGSFFELPGSDVNGAFLDSNTQTGLIHNSRNNTQLGRYLFKVRNGNVIGGADTTKPTITLTTPAESATYFLNQVVNANYSCQDEDGGSGLASCAGTVANSSPIDTASTGTKTFTVTATDNAGNTDSLTHTYTVSSGGSTETCPFTNPNIVGTQGDDTFNGTSGPDLICGLGGRDVINGLRGADSIHGGSGNDVLYGPRGDGKRDRLHGGDGYDICYGDGGKRNDIMSGCERKIR